MRVGLVIASPLELYADEAQYWRWGQSLEWGYYSKPPMIAWVIHFATAVFGDSEWSIRLLAPVFHAFSASLLFLLSRRMFGPQAGLFTVMTYLIKPDAAKRIAAFSKDVEQVQHRLQKIDNPGQPLILDDAYNSNEIGFKNAAQVLRKLADQRGGKAILVTPGVAELGLEHDRVHGRLGEFVNAYCDHVIAINPARIEAFIDALDSRQVDIQTSASFADARKYVGSFATEKDVVLYENDLPDILEERRVL